MYINRNLMLKLQLKNLNVSQLGKNVTIYAMILLILWEVM